MRLLQLDAGMHPAKEGFSALPFFDEFDLSTVDVLLISQYVNFPIHSLGALLGREVDWNSSRLSSRTASYFLDWFYKRPGRFLSAVGFFYTIFSRKS